MMNEYYCINNDTGELLKPTEARKQWREDYDGDDPTNSIPFEEQYTLTWFADGAWHYLEREAV